MTFLFADKGAHVLVDGQFGSTGKGLFASYLANKAFTDWVERRFDGVISNAGPNSGHTFYQQGEKHVLKQLPTFGVKMALMQNPIPVYLSAGAVIDWPILEAEAKKYPTVPIYIHHNAAVVTPELKAAEMEGSIAAVAGTRSGTGAAQMRKIAREPHAVAGYWESTPDLPPNVHFYDNSDYTFNFEQGRYFVEVSQGFSLGINSQFYPKVTSRECTVMQAISDARIAPKFVTKTYMVIRTFPIRVGNVDGFSSGDWYPGQTELSWDKFPGVVPERTTVTQRIRRIATFSHQQFYEALVANQPDVVLVNFMNYLEGPGAKESFTEALKYTMRQARVEARLLFGYGPEDTDIIPF